MGRRVTTYFPSFADSITGCYQGKQVIADFIKQNYPSEEIRADFSFQSPFNGTQDVLQLRKQ